MNDRNYAGSCDFDSPEPAKLTRKILRIKNSHNGGYCVTCPCCGHVSLFQVAHPLKTEDILNPEALSGDSLREIESGREFRKLPCGDQVTVCRKCGGMFFNQYPDDAALQALPSGFFGNSIMVGRDWRETACPGSRVSDYLGESEKRLRNPACAEMYDPGSKTFR